MIALIVRAEGRVCARGCVAEMAGDRLHRILAALSGGGDAWSSARLCAVCPGIVGVNGAGVMLMSSDIPRGSLNSTDDVSELIEELQYTLGEGPCADACQQDLVVDRLLADVADDVCRPQAEAGMSPAHPAQSGGDSRRKNGCRGPGLDLVAGRS